MNAIVRPPLDGEVLSPRELVAVTAVMNVLRIQPQMVFVPVGSSLAEIVEACQHECGVTGLYGGAFVELGGHRVPRDLWSRIRVKHGAHVLVRAVPKGFLAPLIIGALGLSTSVLAPLLTAAIGIGLSLIANLVMSALFPPASTKADKAKTVYSIGAAKNEVAKWEPIPVILGQCRVAFKYAASPITRFDGDDQFLFMLGAWCIGPVKIEKLKIGETDIDDYEDATHETFSGHLNPSDYPKVALRGLPDHLNVKLYKHDSYQLDLNIKTSMDDGPSTRTTGEDCDRIEVDLVAPQGIYDIEKSSGDKGDHTVKITAEYRAVGTSGAWSLLANIELKADSADPIRRTYSVDPPGNAGQYDVRLTRLTKDHDGSDDIMAQVNWTALRTLRNGRPINFPLPLAVTAIRIKATDELNGTPDDINAVVTSLCRAYDGSSWQANQATRNPADLFRHVLQGPANKKPVANGKIDLTTLQAWWSYCKKKGFTFDMVRDFRTSVWETLRDICAAGRAVPLFRDGVWSVAWEDPDAPVVQHFTPRNSWNFGFRQEYRKLPDALRAKYFDKDKGTEDEVLVFPKGSTKDKNTPNLQTEQAEFPGVTAKKLIHMLGRYRMAEGKLRPATFTFSTDIDHLVCTRGDRVYIAYDELLNTLAVGRVKAVSGQTITLDQPVTMQAGKSYGFRFRRPVSGGFVSYVRQVTTAAGTTDTITLLGTGAVPLDGGKKSAGDLWSFGPLGQEAGIYRVRLIKPGEDFTAEMECVDDAPGIQDADDLPVPDYDSGIATPIDATQFPPQRLAVIETVENVNGVAVFVTTLSWEMPTLASVHHFTATATNAKGRIVKRRMRAPRHSARFENLKPGAWSFRVLAEFSGKRRNRWSERMQATIFGKATRPGDVAALRIDMAGQIATLSWDPLSIPVRDYEVRYSPKASVAWEAMTRLKRVAGTTYQTRLRDGSYAVKARSFGGKFSSQAAYAVIKNSAVVGVNVVQTVTEPGTWLGTKASTVIDHGDLRLTLGSDLFAAPNVFALSDWFSPPTSGEPTYTARGTYDLPTTIDLGAVYTSSVTPTIDAYGSILGVDVFSRTDWFAPTDFFGFDAGDFDVFFEVQATQVDPVLGMWSDWNELVPGDITARALRFRLVLLSEAAGVTPRVRSASVLIDMPDRIVADKDLVVTTAGRTIAFTPPFRELRGISIAAQDLASGDRPSVTAKTASGFTIRFYDASNAPVARTFDYTAIGYGVQQ